VLKKSIILKGDLKFMKSVREVEHWEVCILLRHPVFSSVHHIFILLQRSTFGGTASRYRTRQLNCTFELHILINCVKIKYLKHRIGYVK
jgi:hypothetical protein